MIILCLLMRGLVVVQFHDLSFTQNMCLDITLSLRIPFSRKDEESKEKLSYYKR